MKFLLDANIPYSSKEIFGEEHIIFHVRDLSLQEASDEHIAKWAKENKAALVTRDFDFANILNFPPKEYFFGIVVLKIPYFYTASDIKRVLTDFIRKVVISTIPRSIIIVEEGRFRRKP